MGSNKENVLVAGSDDDSEEEVFFGDMSEKEKRKAAKYARRRTALHTPNFRSDRKLMRCTMGPGELGAVLEEGGAAGDDAASSVCEGAEHDPSCVESDAKEVNAMSNGVVVGDTQNNVNNNSSAAMDTCEEGCEDSVTVTAEDVNELIELVPKLELTDTEVNGNVLTEHDCEQQVSDTASCVQRSPSPSEGEETAAAEIPSRNESAKEKVQDKDEVSPVETAVTASCDTESSSDASDEEAACDAQTAQPVELPTVSPEAPPHGGDDECHSDAAVFKTPLQTPAVSFNSPDEISFKTPAAAPQNPEGEAAETPVWRPKLMGLDTDTPTVQFKTAKPTQQTAHVHLPTARESESEETPTVQLKNSCSMDPDKTPTVQFKTPSCGKGDQSETPATQPGKEAGNAAAPSPAPQLPAVEPRGRDTGGGDTPTISFKPKHRTPTVLPPNSTKIGFKRSSTSAFQVTPQRSEVRSPQHRVLEWPAPRPDGYPVVFKEVNFSPTLKVTDVKDDAATADEPEKLPNPRDSFDFHEREVEHRDDLSPELYSPAWEAGASAAAPAFAFPAQRGGWSLDSALRTWPPRLIPEETLPRLDWDDDEDDDTSPGGSREERSPEADMEEILCRKRQQLDQLRVAKETIQQRIVARQAQRGRGRDDATASLGPRSAKAPCPMPTASTLPRVRYRDTQALSLASRELEAVTQLHTLTNSHRSVKVIKKPRSAHTKHITVAAKEASRLRWPESVVTPVSVKRQPNTSPSAGKPILTQRPTDFTFPYHEELPTVVVVNKSKRTPVGGGGAASHRTLPLVDELETGKKPGPSSDKE